jgi:hypothetical protein
MEAETDDRHLYSGMIRLHKHQSGFEAICCHVQKSNFSASCISLGSRALEITAKFDAPKIRPARVKFGSLSVSYASTRNCRLIDSRKAQSFCRDVSKLTKLGPRTELRGLLPNVNIAGREKAAVLNQRLAVSAPAFGSAVRLGRSNVTAGRDEVEVGGFRRVHPGEDGDVSAVKNRRIFERLVFAFGRGKKHTSKLIAEVVAGRANEIADILDEEEVELIETPVFKGSLDHRGVKMADRASGDLADVGRGAL